MNKACKTRWLSPDSAVRSAVENYPAIIQTLQQLEGKCATSAQAPTAHEHCKVPQHTVHLTFCTAQTF